MKAAEASTSPPKGTETPFGRPWLVSIRFPFRGRVLLGRFATEAAARQAHERAERLFGKGTCR